MQILQKRVPSLHVGGSDLPRLCLRWLPPALVRRVAAAPLSTPDVAHPLSRFVYKPWRTCPLIPIAPSISSCLRTQNVSTVATKDSTQCKHTRTQDGVYLANVIPNSSHRDGLIYKNKIMLEDFHECDITNRNETQLEPMRFSKALRSCMPLTENCLHLPHDMIQFFSVQLATSPISTPPIQLYGYIAARDVADGMLNYVVNYSRDEPIVVQPGSLIEMTGPKRAIEMTCLVLIEFDMRIKNGMHEDDDEQFIDGAIMLFDHRPIKPVKNRVVGNGGSVDILFGSVILGVEAIIEVTISEVRSGLSLSLSSFVEAWDSYDYEEIKLFHGTIVQSGALRRFVVAVPWDTLMILRFKTAEDMGLGRHIKFDSRKHGCSRQQIALDVAAISVKVTWSTI